jgi:ankyrin repeat protein
MSNDTDDIYNINNIYDCSPITKCSKFTKLHYLLRYQNKTKQECLEYEFELTKDLLKYLNCKNENQWTPLMLSARNGYIKMVRRLLSAGADPNLQNKNCNSALLMVFTATDLDKDLNRDLFIEMVKLLLEYKANPNLRNKYGKAILDYCEPSKIELLLILNIKIISANDLKILKYYNMLYAREQIIKEQNKKIKMLENKINELSYLPPDIGGNQYISAENNYNKN